MMVIILNMKCSLSIKKVGTAVMVSLCFRVFSPPTPHNLQSDRERKDNSSTSLVTSRTSLGRLLSALVRRHRLRRFLSRLHSLRVNGLRRRLQVAHPVYNPLQLRRRLESQVLQQVVLLLSTALLAHRISCFAPSELSSLSSGQLSVD